MNPALIVMTAPELVAWNLSFSGRPEAGSGAVAALSAAAIAAAAVAARVRGLHRVGQLTGLAAGQVDGGVQHVAGVDPGADGGRLGPAVLLQQRRA